MPRSSQLPSDETISPVNYDCNDNKQAQSCVISFSQLASCAMMPYGPGLLAPNPVHMDTDHCSLPRVYSVTRPRSEPCRADIGGGAKRVFRIQKSRSLFPRCSITNISSMHACMHKLARARQGKHRTARVSSVGSLTFDKVKRPCLLKGNRAHQEPNGECVVFRRRNHRDTGNHETWHLIGSASPD